MKMTGIKQISRSFIVVTALLLTSITAKANLLTDLQTLILDARALETQLKMTTITADNVCGPLLEVTQSTRDFNTQVVQVDNNMTAPIQIDNDILLAMNELTGINLSLANESVRLSADLGFLSSSMNALSIKDGLTLMLQLSDEIGIMADRIGEMADNILVMSDNIGAMADQIVLSQELQSENFILTQQSVLQAQTNSLALVSVTEDSIYAVNFNQIITDGGLLSLNMNSVVLTSWKMDQQLEDVVADVKIFLQLVQQTGDLISSDSTQSNMVSTTDSLTLLSQMSLMLTSLSTAVDGYAIMISGLQAVTYDPRLDDATQSVLQLSGDINLMSGTILEMADNILLMSDNIGMQANEILATQAAMNVNAQSTQAALLAAQEMMINVIDTQNL